MKTVLTSNRRALALAAVLGALLLQLSGCASFHQTAQRGAIGRAYGSYREHDYVRALRRLSEAESFGEVTPERRAEICFLKGQCVEGLGNRAEAASLYEFLLKTYPDSEFAARAKGRLEELRQKP